MTGVGVLSKNGFKGFLKDEAVKGMQWMQEENSQGAVTFKLESNERDYLTVDLEKMDLNVTPIVKNNDVKFEINVNFNATINGFKEKVSSEEIRKNIIAEVKKEIRETYEKGLKQDIDIYRLSEYLYRKNVSVWKK